MSTAVASSVEELALIVAAGTAENLAETEARRAEEFGRRAEAAREITPKVIETIASKLSAAATVTIEPDSFRKMPSHRAPKHENVFEWTGAADILGVSFDLIVKKRVDDETEAVTRVDVMVKFRTTKEVVKTSRFLRRRRTVSKPTTILVRDAATLLDCINASRR